MRAEDHRHLLDRASRGDQAAVDTLLEEHLPKLEAFVRLRMGAALRAKESCSDLVQSTCREVLQHAGRFRFGEESGFRHWLFATALRKIKNRYEYYRAARRDLGRERSLDTEDPKHLRAVEQCYLTLATPTQELRGREQRERFEAAFAQLPEHYQEVISLTRIVGLSYRETAQEMGRTEGSVRNLLHRALAELSMAMNRE